MPKYTFEDINKEEYVSSVLKDMTDHFEEYTIPLDSKAQKGFIDKYAEAFDSQAAEFTEHSGSRQCLGELLADYNRVISDPNSITPEVMKGMYANIYKLFDILDMRDSNLPFGLDNHFPPETRSIENYKEHAQKIWVFLSSFAKRIDDAGNTVNASWYKYVFFDRFDFKTPYTAYALKENEALNKRRERDEIIIPEEVKAEWNDIKDTISIYSKSARSVNLIGRFWEFASPTFGYDLNAYFHVRKTGEFADVADRDRCFRILGNALLPILHMASDDNFPSWETQFPEQERTPELFLKKMEEVWNFLKFIYAKAGKDNFITIADPGLLNQYYNEFSKNYKATPIDALQQENENANADKDELINNEAPADKEDVIDEKDPIDDNIIDVQEPMEESIADKMSKEDYIEASLREMREHFIDIMIPYGEILQNEFLDSFSQNYYERGSFTPDVPGYLKRLAEDFNKVKDSTKEPSKDELDKLYHTLAKLNYELGVAESSSVDSQFSAEERTLKNYIENAHKAWALVTGFCKKIKDAGDSYLPGPAWYNEKFFQRFNFKASYDAYMTEKAKIKRGPSPLDIKIAEMMAEMDDKDQKDPLKKPLNDFEVAANAHIWGSGGHPTEFNEIKKWAKAYKKSQDDNEKSENAKRLYSACRVYLNAHTDDGNTSNIGGQATIGGRMRKQAVVQLLKTMELSDKPYHKNVTDAYSKMCAANNKPYLILNYGALEASLASHSKASLEKGDENTDKVKAYKELKLAAKAFKAKAKKNPPKPAKEPGLAKNINNPQIKI